MCGTHDPRLAGLARNASAPAEVLLRLLATGIDEVRFALCGRSELPDEVIDAILAHPDRTVRRSFAGNSRIGPRIRSRLADDPDAGVRAAVVENSGLFWKRSTSAPRPLTIEAYERLASDPESRVREEVALHPYTPDHVRTRLAADPSPEVRILLLDLWRHLTDEVKGMLLADRDAEVREAAHHERQRERSAVAADKPVARLSEEETRIGILSRAQAEGLARDTDPRTRAKVAGNPNLDDDLVSELAVDADPDVRLAVSTRPGLSERERAAIDYHLEPRARFYPLPWVLALSDDEQAMRECAVSAHPALRRSAAFCPHLPPDLTERLADDEDFLVRLFLAENHPDAPGLLLLRTVLEFDGYSVAAMLRHPNSPRHGLRRFADSSEPKERRLVAMDPTTPAEVIEQLSRDGDRSVRAAMAHDPRLSTARLVVLLADPDTAAAAAANPSLPVPAMMEILERAT
ncbi:hypothetical protein GCM10010191_88030 [Actinomadura vinacea]|uniref:Leucine rich repeat variant n=2 Tax=Actinomadura vinacea TaxID=115336 RepID=A0ABP5XNC5_9ACTN